ncbi:MAG: LysR family transcriptional regulator [Gammaproteobacteria bacterium]
MKLQQLRHLVAVADAGLNVTAAAQSLHTSQPGISKRLRLLEEELGLRLFIRRSRALVRTTPAGDKVIARARVILREVANIRGLAAEMRAGGVDTTFARLDSLAGHDAFLVDFPAFDATVRPWLAARSP